MLGSSEQRHYFLGSSGLEDRMNQMCAKLLGPSEENILGLPSLLESSGPPVLDQVSYLDFR